MKIKKHIAVCLCVLFAQAVFAQGETLTPLRGNGVLMKQKEVLSTQKVMGGSTGGDTIELPFYDDFTYGDPYPSTSLWMNSKSVYVNNTFGMHPRNIGVATFDGLKSTGYPYKPFGSSGVENADTLTSKYIRLDSVGFLRITPADSVYLSFYYQSTGFGHRPNNNHTLILDFFNPTTNAWVSKMTLVRPTGSSATAKDTTFTRVMIPITDPQYFKKNFRFRFRNKNSATGSVNHWHIDNVYLGRDRGRTDTLLNDVAYVYDPQSLIRDYTAMPYEQYTGAAQMADHSWLTIRNNFPNNVNFTGFIQVRDNNNVLQLNDTTGTINSFPFYPNGYEDNPDIVDFMNSSSSPQINNFVYNNGNPLSDSITYTVKHFMDTGDNYRGDDTVCYQQKFMNYYAYDDGSAEWSWGIIAQSPPFYGAETAVQYSLSNPDVLRAIDIFFDPVPNPGFSVDQISHLAFGLRVWNDNGGVPGSYLYDDNNSMNRTPHYYDWGMNNQFTRYYLNYPLTMSAGTFYVGMKQEDLYSLSIGFDKSRNMQSKIFHNEGTWLNSGLKGTLMIRPVFGDSLWAATGVKEEVTKKENVKVYPNPANEKVYVITGSAADLVSVEVVDALGSTQIKQTLSSDRSISTIDLNNGFYFIRIYKDNQLLSVEKIIVAH